MSVCPFRKHAALLELRFFLLTQGRAALSVSRRMLNQKPLLSMQESIMQWKPHRYPDHTAHSSLIYSQTSNTEVMMNVW